MVPRADIIAVQQDIALGELVKVFENAGHSRLVVYDDTLDDPIGMVHIRDLIAFMTDARRRRAPKPIRGARSRSRPASISRRSTFRCRSSTAKIMREILFVPPSMPALDLLAKMQATRIHLALVVDEYGGTDGLVSMEDIVEQIVGDIADEHDEDERPAVVRQPDGSFLADARASLEDVTAVVGAGFDVGEVAEEVDTLGGYLDDAGRPRAGARRARAGPGRFEIEVLDADPRRVKKLSIYLQQRPQRQRPREPRRAAPQRPPARDRASCRVNRDAAVKLSPDDAPSKGTRPPVIATRLAHSIVLAWGWRRALIAFARRRVVGAGAGAVRCSGRCCSSPSRSWSG